jgi:hypothetical protein
MGFRRPLPLAKRTDPWAVTLRANKALAERSGVPAHILEDSQRFAIFVQHGYDESAWLEDQKARTRGKVVDVFRSRSLSDDQLRALANLARELLGTDEYRLLITSHWQRGG